MDKKRKKQNTNKSQFLPIETFSFAVKKVKAYRDFLKKYGIKPNLIKTREAFETLPITDKNNYLRAHNFTDLLPNNKVPAMISASSGSSGQPFYWPRDDEHEVWGGVFHNIILQDIFKLKGKKVLVVICFSMGNWIAGTFTLASIREVARKKGFQITVITPGIDVNDTISVLKNFTEGFDSLILFGYPPFLMDIIVDAEATGVNFKKLDMYFILAGENFSEKWRELVHKITHTPKDEFRTISIYGTADAGAIGHETPLTITLRKLSLKDTSLKKELYGPMSFIPTTVMYYPHKTYFEIINGELVFTAMAGIPLIRYNIKDHGTLLSQTQVKAILKRHGYNSEIKKYINKWKGSILILKGRNDVLVTFYALNIYPENIKAGLEDDEVIPLVTGKYIVQVEQSSDFREQIFNIEIELKQHVSVSEKTNKIISESILKHLVELNTEYRKLYNSIHEKALPVIKLVPFGHEKFITRKSKHNWVKKN